MSPGASEVLQSEASIQIARAPLIPDFLLSTYPEWSAVEEVLEEFDAWEAEHMHDNQLH
ncbi:hypothetical protein [Rhizobium sp. P28RR-XV]|uniref:hypothetical protein n=1 Tax=Rhizobium sp. P28RR-XV TaxID=2726737 RepID=UPI0014571891|nr:hypothetical protein [Rhizobium sp. P28RR-XV]NLR88207.1 hypothetical protein [Rhizobium sp. P28RR-XV]